MKDFFTASSPKEATGKLALVCGITFVISVVGTVALNRYLEKKDVEAGRIPGDTK